MKALVMIRQLPAVSTLTAERLREVLHYDRSTGVFTWRSPRPGRKACAGVLSGNYLRIRIDGTLHHAHRLAVLYETGAWPGGRIDHRDGWSNAAENLRPATATQNLANARIRSDNTSGFKGVSRVAGSATWKAQIQVDGEVLHLLCCERPEDAAEAYDRAAIHHFGEFAKTNRSMGLLS